MAMWSGATFFWPCSCRFCNAAAAPAGGCFPQQGLLLKLEHQVEIAVSLQYGRASTTRKDIFIVLSERQFSIFAISKI